MKIHFYKYQGAGNDFIILDNRSGETELSEKEINFLCDRRFGIGADGLMTLGLAPAVDFNMRYYNADGKEGPMCGNGGRCLVAFAAHKGIKNFTFSASDGMHRAEVLARHGNECQICLQMTDVNKVSFYSEDGYVLNTGAPHLVLFGTGLAKLDVTDRGPFWRNHPDFTPEGVNVNFVELEHDTLFVRTFERGVEDETLACGTGVTASAIAAYMRSIDKNVNKSEGRHTYKIRARGGNLQVDFDADKTHFSNILLTGPARFVYEGEIEV